MSRGGQARVRQARTGHTRVGKVRGTPVISKQDRAGQANAEQTRVGQSRPEHGRATPVNFLGLSYYWWSTYLIKHLFGPTNPRLIRQYLNILDNLERVKRMISIRKISPATPWANKMCLLLKY